MVQSSATTVDDYLSELDPARREVVSTVRDTVRSHLPDGFEEAMRWGMISYEIPLRRYPDTYNGQPLSYVALASQKRHVSLYLSGIYADPALSGSFEQRWRETGKRLDRGKSCVRFSRLETVPLDLIAEVVGAMSVEDYIERYEASRR